MPLDSGVPRRFPSRALEQSPWRLRQDAGLQQDIKDLADGRDRGRAPLVSATSVRSMARKYARATGLPGGGVSCSRRSSRDIRRNARACAGVTYPSCSRRFSRWNARSNAACSRSVSRSSSPSISGREFDSRLHAAHDALKAVVMVGIEGRQHGDDRVPGVGARRDDQIAADLAAEPVGGHGWRDCRGIEDARVVGERSRHQIDVHARHDLGSGAGTGFHQRFDPHAESIGVELFVEARLIRPPHVEIEDARQLLRRRQREELAAILEAAALNHAVKHLRGQSRHDERDIRRAQHALEQAARVERQRPRPCS